MTFMYVVRTSGDPPVPADECEQLVYGQNLAMSPDEYQAAHGTTIPAFGPPGYPGYDTNSTPSAFEISDANPDSGTWHVRSPNVVSGSRKMRLHLEQDCPEVISYSARCEPGDTVTLGGRWVRVSGTGLQEPQLEISFVGEAPSYDNTGGAEFGTGEGTIPASYTFYETAQVAPAGTRFAICTIGWEGTGDGVIDMDTFSIVVTAA